jgi:hypothetical protein
LHSKSFSFDSVTGSRQEIRQGTQWSQSESQAASPIPMRRVQFASTHYERNYERDWDETAFKQLTLIHHWFLLRPGGFWFLPHMHTFVSS